MLRQIILCHDRPPSEPVFILVDFINDLLEFVKTCTATGKRRCDKKSLGMRRLAHRMMADALRTAPLAALCRTESSENLSMQPIYLFADSQLLFWRNQDGLFLDSIRKLIDGSALKPKAAYVGASNGDDPAFYSIFEAAMEGIGIKDCRMILSSLPADDRLFIDDSDIILLAGGDVERGWNVFKETGLKEVIIRKYYEGSVLIGISAGAVQLGLFGLSEEEESANRLIDTFKLIPFIISAHEEREEWISLKGAIQLFNGSIKGIGIPTGGGLVYHPDHSIEAIRYPSYELTMRDGELNCSLLIPA
jgi:cyanophycinase